MTMELADNPVLMDIEPFQFSGEAFPIVEIAITDVLELVHDRVPSIWFGQVRLAFLARSESPLFGLLGTIEELDVLLEG